MTARAAPYLLAAVLLAGCAPVPPPMPVPSIQTIQGKWYGQIKFGGGPYQMLWLTVNPDAGLVMVWGSNTKWGKVLLYDGRARFDVGTWSGTLNYYEGSEGRLLTMDADFNVFDARVKPDQQP